MAYAVIEKGPGSMVYVGPFTTSKQAEHWANTHSLEFDVIELEDPKRHQGQADLEQAQADAEELAQRYNPAVIWVRED